jgi:hypothetical protein
MHRLKYTLEPKHVRYLKPQFVDNPEKMLQEFASMMDYAECRDDLWHLLKGFFSTEDTSHLNATDRSNYLFFYEELQALLEAVFLLHQRKQQQNTNT